MSNKGLIFVISSPSGGGKTSIVRRITERDGTLNYIVSATTRPRRSGEREGIDYIFLTEEEFSRWEEEGRFIETTHYHNHHYGTPKEPLLTKIDRGEDVILDIDVNGGKQVKDLFPEAVLIFLLPPSKEELRRRLLERGRESEEEIEARLRKAEQEIRSANDYDYLVINRDLDQATGEIISIIAAERSKRKKGG